MATEVSGRLAGPSGRGPRRGRPFRSRRARFSEGVAESGTSALDTSTEFSGNLHQKLLAELLSATPVVVPVFEIDKLDGTIVKVSREAVSSVTLGYYKKQVRRFGDIAFNLSSWRGGIEAPTLSVDIDDTGGAFTLEHGRELRGLVCRAKLVSPNLTDPAAFFTWFTGVIDGVSKSGNSLSLSARMNDDVLALKVTRAAIRSNLFSSLHPDTTLKGQFVPVGRGDFDSTGLAANGMVKALYVGVVSGKYRYLVTLGWWLSVGRVFSDGAIQTVGTHYQPVQSLSGDARKVTFIDFVADQGTNEVICDVRDTESPSGPAATLQRLLADVAWNDYHGELKDVSTVPLDQASVDSFDTFAASLGLSRSIWVPSGGQAVGDILRSFVQSFDAQVYWRHDGKLVVLPWDLRAQNSKAYLGPGAPDTELAKVKVLHRDLYKSEPDFEVDPEASITVLNGKSGKRPSDDSFLNNRAVVVKHGTGVMERARDLELPYLPVTAESIGNIIYLVPSATVSSNGYVTEGAVSDWQALGQGPPPKPYVQSIRLRTDNAGAMTAPFGTYEAVDMPDVVAIATVAIWITLTTTYWDPNDTDTLSVGLKSAGGIGYTTVVSTHAGGLRAAGVFTADPGTSQAWTKTGLDAYRLHWDWEPTGAVDSRKRLRIHQLFAIVNYTAAANVSPALLQLLSRVVNRYRTPPELMTVRAPLHFLNYRLGDDLPLVDEREGWGSSLWARGRGRLVGLRVLPDQNSVELTLELVKRQLTSLWILGKALAGVDGTSAIGNGTAVLTNGVTVSVTRDSVKQVDSPAGIEDGQNAGPVAQLLNHTWPSERRGTLIEALQASGLTRTSFKSGNADLGESAGSGTIEYDTTVGEQLFIDPNVTGKHLKVTAGNPHTAETRVTLPTVTSASTGVHVISIDHRESSLAAGDESYWRCTRNSDGFYWNDDAGSFQASAYDNKLPSSVKWERFKSKQLPAAGKGATLTLSVSVLAGGTAERVHRFGHAQVELNQFASSRIVCDGSIVTRAADVIKLENDKDGYYTHPHERGQLNASWEFLWSSADLTVGTVMVLYYLVYGDANNGWALQYVVGTGFRAVVTSAGVPYIATVNVPVTAGKLYELAWRWTSSLGEWDKPLTSTLTVKEDGVKVGSAEVAYVSPVFSAGAWIYLCNGTTLLNQANGYLAELRIVPLSQSDTELGL